jgi:hypothetical protein
MSGLLPAAVHAGSVPSNDLFANGTVINPSSLPYSQAANALGASTQTNEPDSACSGTNSGSIWWRFRPSTTGTYRVDTIGSDFDTQIDVYRGPSLVDLLRVECNNDIDSNNPDLTASRVAFRATAGQLHHIRVIANATSGVTARLQLRKVTPPSNDFYANARKISSLPFSTNANNINATSQPNEPRPVQAPSDSPCGHQRATRWYKYTPSANQVIWANTFGGTDFDTILGVYTGSTIGNAQMVACNDSQWLGGHQTDSAGVTFRATAGVTYRFQVGGYDAESGDVNELPFQVRAIASVESNDDFANAAAFTQLPYVDAFNLRRASTQTGEPKWWFSEVNTVWYRYTAQGGQAVDVFTEGDDICCGVGVAAYRATGPGFAGLQLIGYGSGVGFTTSPGQVYYIQVFTQFGFAPAAKVVIELD